MSNDDTAIEKLVLTRLMRLNALILGFIGGSILGFIIFAITLYLVLKGGPNVGMHLVLLDNFFPGYSVTLIGSFIGLFYGFVTGFVIAYVVGFLYNSFAGWREVARSRRPK